MVYRILRFICGVEEQHIIVLVQYHIAQLVPSPLFYVTLAVPQFASDSLLLICNDHLPSRLNERISYGSKDLYVHLCLLFNSLLRHSFVPSQFCFGMMIKIQLH